MQKQSLQFGMLIIMIVFAGCQKDLKNPSISTSVESNVMGGENGNKIRLTSSSSEYGTSVYDYNEKGLLKNWALIDFGYLFVHEYDDKNRLARAWFYINEELINTVVFFYNQQGQRFHEIWYAGSSTTIADEVYYTFDNKGNGIKLESVVLDYYVLNSYTEQGNLLEWKYYSGNQLLFGSTYTFFNRLKNPESAIPGLVFGWPFINGFFASNKWYSTSENYSEYDENGNVIFSSPQDPSKTVAVAGPQNYVATSNFWDVLGESYVHFIFTYENCGACESKKIRQPQSTNARKMLQQKLLLKVSNKVLKDKVNELRRN